MNVRDYFDKQDSDGKEVFYYGLISKLGFMTFYPIHKDEILTTLGDHVFVKYAGDWPLFKTIEDDTVR